jgi:hypothetical protein
MIQLILDALSLLVNIEYSKEASQVIINVAISDGASHLDLHFEHSSEGVVLHSEVHPLVLDIRNHHLLDSSAHHGDHSPQRELHLSLLLLQLLQRDLNLYLRSPE